MKNRRGKVPRLKRRGFLGLLLPMVACRSGRKRETLYVVANMHGDCMGWLAPFWAERNWALYSYLDHQDLAVQDPNYHYVMSEIPNVITMMEYEPQRFEELKRLIKEGRVELPNAFPCESTVNLAGGEAMVMQVVEGLRWYKQVMDISPRHAYSIDIVGWHEQMAQMVAGLELESFIYCRYNPTIDKPSDGEMIAGGAPLHWIESPDGTRALAINPGHYTGAFSSVMRPREALPPDKIVAELKKNVARVRDRWKRNPGAPMMTFAGQADYSLSFNYKGYPKELLAVWEASRPDTKIKFSTLQEWFDEARPGIHAGKHELLTVKTGSKSYAGSDEWAWGSFWVLAPKAKQWYRRSEHLCQASEALTAVSSLRADLDYPSQDYSNVWFLLALNLDRGPMWGIAVSGVYEHPKGWDMRDRFEMAGDIARRWTAKAMTALLGQGKDAVGLFNPANWELDGLLELGLPAGMKPRGVPSQLLEDGKTTLARVKLPSLGLLSLALEPGAPESPKRTSLPPVIENDHYRATVDPNTGALVSLKLKPSGREVLGGPANVVQAQVNRPEFLPKDNPEGFDDWDAHNLFRRNKRQVIASTNDRKPALSVLTGPLATTVETTCPFPGGILRRTIRFYTDSPRIDFVTETNDVPAKTAIVADFPLATEVISLRRGIPYGFSHGQWAGRTPEQRGNHEGIVPVIRFSDYTLAGGGAVSLLDRGVPGRELVDRTATILLHYSIDSYYTDTKTNWMSGRGKQTFQYALLAREEPWEKARVARAAWEYNAPPLLAGGVKSGAGESFLETSGNVIVEALRRVDNEIEIRMVECLGMAGVAAVTVRLPHSSAAMTNMLGRQRTALQPQAGPGEYRIPIRPQQIVTLRLRTRDAIPPVEAVRTFDPLVPPAKREFTRSFRHPEHKGYPPRMLADVWKWKSHEEKR